jgi:hypothetical protein
MTDPKNQLTWTQLLASKSHATNNVGSSGLDVSAYEGSLACIVNIGVKTAGDNDGAVTVQIKASATNALANATNITTATSAVSTTNNTAAHGVITFDKRAEYRYLFALVTLSGTNSPAYPVSVSVGGKLKSQP